MVVVMSIQGLRLTFSRDESYNYHFLYHILVAVATLVKAQATFL